MKTCQICNKDYDDSSTICPYCSASDVMSLNWREWIRQMEMEYSKALGADYLTKGLQKDAIQNGWGARLNKKGAEWSFEFELIEDKSRGNFLLVTDQISYGLTGEDIKTLASDELKKKENRLARFRSMLYSGDNQQGAGSFGRGKTLYLASSKKHYIIYDSFTHKKEYKLGFTRIEGDELKNSKIIFIEDKAKKYLKEHVSERIRPLSKCGTRIIIIDPREELIEAIKTGRLVKYIGDTWWPILKRDLKIAVICNGKKVEAMAPIEFRDLRSTDSTERKCRTYSPSFDYKGTKCKFKRVQMFLSNKKRIPEEIQGIHLYRREMKIGQIEVKEVPPEIAEKYYGYVELETVSPLENIYMEQAVEGLDHSSFDGHKGIFQHIKSEIQDCFNKFKEEMGYGYYKGQEERKTKEASDQALLELQKEWPDLSGVAEGTPPPLLKKLEIRLVSLEFPRPQEKYVRLGEDLTNIVFKIKNVSSSDLNLFITIKTMGENHNMIDQLMRENITIEVNKAWKNIPIGFNVNSSKYNNNKFYLVCSCEHTDGKIEAEKNITIYIGPFVAPQFIKPISLELESIIFPKDRRVDFGQKVTQIKYIARNETSIKINARFRLRVLDYNTKQQEIVICEKDIALKPNGEEDIICPDFEVEAEKYIKVLEGTEKGSVILRASVVNLNNFSVNYNEEIKTYEKGDKLAIYDTRFWINCEAGKGIFDRVDCSWDGGEEEPKSRVEGSTFILNNTHPEFIVIKDSGDQSGRKNFIYEQYCRQGLILIVRKGKFDKWPDHPRYPDCKKDIQKDKPPKEDIIDAIFKTIDYRLAVHYK